MNDIYKFVIEEFIPKNIKRKMVDDVIDSDTLEYYYIDSKDIYMLDFEYDVLEYIKEIITSMNIRILNVENEDTFIPLTRKFKVNVTPSFINEKIKLMNTYPYHSKEYLSIRNEIFLYYIDYPKFVAHKFVEKYNLPIDDCINDIQVFILEAIEKYDFSMFFSSFMALYINRGFAEEYRLSGIGILLSEDIYNNEEQESYESKYISEVFHNRTVLDDDFYLEYSDIDALFDKEEEKWFKDLVMSLIIHLEDAPSAKRKTKQTMDRYKKILIVYYGINTGKKLTVKECADFFGKKEKWVYDNLLFARKFLAEMVIMYNMNAKEEEKIYLY